MFDLAAFRETEGACSALTNTCTLRAEQAMTSDQTQQQDEFEQRKSRELSRQRSRPPIDVPGYEARQFLGTGAYGEVWVAIDKNTGRKVAIKFYAQKSGVDWSLLSREVEKLVFLSADRYVVQLLDVGWDAEPPYYVMEYVEGGSLQQLLEKEGPLPVGEAVETFREIATGLLHAHGKGVLHCDLKPDNILLDQDRKPRLADFGQSRLSHEQTPALGTLFFMAPEQADLSAVPDARWDVYALGALLYCMLTGTSPYRTESLLSQIDSCPNLAERLETYRDEIKNAPVPTAHRDVDGVDRELADIIDRCLAVDPAQRFPNVQSVLTAIRSRDASKDRRPLLLLGLLGPLLFLTVLGLFGRSAYRKSVQDSDSMVRRGARSTSRFAAKFAAETVARRIDHYYDLVTDEADDAEFQKMVASLQKDPEIESLLGDLVISPEIDGAKQQESRERFVSNEGRNELSMRLDALLTNNQADDIASWFVTDANGVQLASAISNERSPDSTVGFDYSRRAYFHGGRYDKAKGIHHADPPLSETKLSSVFKSEASGTWKVAVSTPIKHEGQIIGVVALTVELGHLGSKEFASSDDMFQVLVDARDGQILQHPLYNEVLEKKKQEKPDEVAVLPDYSNYKVDLSQLLEPEEEVDFIRLYTDPLGDAPDGATYAQRWVAAQQPVRLADFDPGLTVLIQQNYEEAAKPVVTLGQGLIRDAFVALMLSIAGVLYLWYLVTRALRDPNEAMRRAGGATVLPSSLHSMETLELPEKLRERQRPSV